MVLTPSVISSSKFLSTLALEFGSVNSKSCVVAQPGCPGVVLGGHISPFTTTPFRFESGLASSLKTSQGTVVSVSGKLEVRCVLQGKGAATVRMGGNPGSNCDPGLNAYTLGSDSATD